MLTKGPRLGSFVIYFVCLLLTTITPGHADAPVNDQPEHKGDSSAKPLAESAADTTLDANSKAGQDQDGEVDGVEKRAMDRYAYFGRLGKRNLGNTEHSWEADKRGMDRYSFFGQVGKRGMDVQDLWEQFGQREGSGFNDQLDKRAMDRYAFMGRLGKRNDKTTSQSGAHQEAEGSAHRTKRGLDSLLSSDLSKRVMDSMMFGPQLGKRERMDSRMFGPQLGKREKMDSMMFGSRLGKRRMDSMMFGPQLGKRERMDSMMFGPQLGKRERMDSMMFGSRLGKRERMDSRMFGPQLGKRERMDRFMFGGRLGKRDDDWTEDDVPADEAAEDQVSS